MKRDKWIHCYVNSTRTQQMKAKIEHLCSTRRYTRISAIYRLRNGCKQICTGG